MAKKKLYDQYCNKCAEPRGLEISAHRIQAKCDICGKNKLCTNAKAIRKAEADAKKAAKKNAPKKTTAKKTSPKKNTPKKGASPKGKSIPAQILEVLGASNKGMTADHIIEKLPKKTNRSSATSAITRLKSSKKIVALKKKIKSTDGKMETAYKLA